VSIAPGFDLLGPRARRALGDAYFDRKEYAHALPHFEVLSQDAEKQQDGDKNGMLHFRYAFCLADVGKTHLAVR
jgi:hypothetical protein